MKFLRKIYAWIVALLSPEPRKERDLGDKSFKILQDLDKKHEKGTSTFDPKSPQAIAGLAFQTSVFEELQKEFPDNDTFEEEEFFELCSIQNCFHIYINRITFTIFCNIKST